MPSRLEYDADSLVNVRPLLVLCAMGGRSAQVTAWLNRQGITAANLEGGYEAWVAAGHQIEHSAAARARLLG